MSAGTSTAVLTTGADGGADDGVVPVREPSNVLPGLLVDGVEEPDWQERALCAQTDPEAFFPERGGSTREAKRICSGCDVRAECLDYAFAHDERFGVWGGLSEWERTRLRRGKTAVVDGQVVKLSRSGPDRRSIDPEGLVSGAGLEQVLLAPPASWIVTAAPAVPQLSPQDAAALCPPPARCADPVEACG